MATIQKKLVLVGGEESGKTCMLLRKQANAFQGEFTPKTMGGNIIFAIDVDGQKVNLDTRDTPSWQAVGPSEVQYLADYFNGAQIAIICFALDSSSSLEHAKTRRAPEMKKLLRSGPFLLVGCKKDLREGSQGVITYEEGAAAAREIGAVRYMECSAKKGEGVVEIFEQAAREALHDKVKPKGCGCVVQ